MKTTNLLTRRALVAALSALTLTAGTLPAFAHDTPCPYCKMKVTQDTPEQDNETVLRLGRKRIEYKCVYCAMADANTKYKDSGDVTILAPSEKKSAPIEIMRMDGKWMAPDGTVFVGVKASHKVCQTTYRAFTNKAAYDAYVAKNKSQLDGAKPLTLTEMLTVAAK